MNTRHLTAAAFFLAGTAAFAQTSGTAHPEELQDTITTTAAVSAGTPAPASAPAPSIPALKARPADEVYVASAVPVATERVLAQPITLRTPVPDPADAGIVTDYPYTANALGEGTLLKARLTQRLSTTSTVVGTHFTARLSDNIEHAGQVIFPAGSTLEGRVSEVRGGRRIGGKASLHLVPESLTLPDGSQYKLSARVIDLEQYRNAHVDAEGTILRTDHAKGTLAALTLTAGSGAAAGALLAGVPGALVGAGIGAGVGTAVWLRQDRQETLAAGSQIIFSLTRPLELTPIQR